MHEATDSEPLPASPPPIVTVRGLVKHYGETQALRGVSFDVPRGDIFGFIGPNGAGKTTTLRILATLLEPTAGQVFIDGLCVENDTDEVRRVIGYMPDHFGVYDGITVEEYMEFFAAAYRILPPTRGVVVKDVMALTDLTPLKDRTVSALSKGMRQRLCLAKTLVHDPKVLILDEPASFLDPRARIEMRELFKELSRMGKTIIISSHILTELSDICTSVAIVEKGELVECGKVEILERKRWRADNVKIVLHEPRPEVEGLLARCPSVAAVRCDKNQITFEYGGAPGEFHKVLKVLTDREIPVVSVEHESKDLEDLFMELTRGDLQ